MSNESKQSSPIGDWKENELSKVYEKMQSDMSRLAELEEKVKEYERRENAALKLSASNWKENQIGCMNWVEAKSGSLPHDHQEVLIWRKSESAIIAKFYKKDQFGTEDVFVIKGVGAHITLDWVTHWAEITNPHK